MQIDGLTLMSQRVTFCNSKFNVIA